MVAAAGGFTGLADDTSSFFLYWSMPIAVDSRTNVRLASGGRLSTRKGTSVPAQGVICPLFRERLSDPRTVFLTCRAGRSNVPPARSAGQTHSFKTVCFCNILGFQVITWRVRPSGPAARCALAVSGVHKLTEPVSIRSAQRGQGTVTKQRSTFFPGLCFESVSVTPLSLRQAPCTVRLRHRHCPVSQPPSGLTA